MVRLPFASAVRTYCRDLSTARGTADIQIGIGTVEGSAISEVSRRASRGHFSPFPSGCLRQNKIAADLRDIEKDFMSLIT
jgi:hypothetical protein